MAIKKTFGASSIRKPGAYSKSKVDNSSGAPIGSNDTLFIIGEASAGKPGDVAGIEEFAAERIDTLVDTYVSGPIVDCALAALRPSKTPGVSGAGRIMVWKTNSSTQASLTVNEATDTNPLLVIKDKKWGVKGNDLSVTIANGTNAATQKLITINKLNDTAESLGENNGDAVLSITYTGDATTATATVTGASKAAKVLATTLAGDQTDGSVNLSITLANYNMKELVDFINAQTGYTCTLSTTSSAAKTGTELDPVVTPLDITTAKSLYRIQEEIIALINDESDRVEASLHATPREGLPNNITSEFLTGGALGASINSDFSDGLSASLAKDYNVALPAISRDAADDIADAEQGFTDASSTYTIASVLASLSSHLTLRSSVKNRKEAQGMGGVREAAKADAFATISGVGSELVQLCMQDVLVLDETATLTWKHPHVQAALMAGIRLGTDVGEPLTHKFLNCNGIGHDIDPTDGLEDGDFNEATDVDDAIDNGVLFAETVAGGFRVVVDNTTYGADQSFVFNRGSVVEAAQFVAKTIRETAELVFVGQKVSNGLASSIKTVIRNKLRELNAPEVNIITASDDAPEGFVEETFTVTVTGNTAEVQVEVKPVQGLDFVFITFTLGDIQQSA